MQGLARRVLIAIPQITSDVTWQMQRTVIIAVTATEIVRPTDESDTAKMTTADDHIALDRTVMTIDEIIPTASTVTGTGMRMENISAPDVRDTIIETEITEVIDPRNVARHPRSVELAKLPNGQRSSSSSKRASSTKSKAQPSARRSQSS